MIITESIQLWTHFTGDYTCGNCISMPLYAQCVVSLDWSPKSDFTQLSMQRHSLISTFSDIDGRNDLVKMQNSLLFIAKSSEKKYDNMQMIIIPRKSNDSIFTLTDKRWHLPSGQIGKHTAHLHRAKTRWLQEHGGNTRKKRNLSMNKYHCSNQRVQCLVFCQHYSAQQFSISSCPKRESRYAVNATNLKWQEMRCTNDKYSLLHIFNLMWHSSSWHYRFPRWELWPAVRKTNIIVECRWSQKRYRTIRERLAMYQKHRCSIKE